MKIVSSQSNTIPEKLIIGQTLVLIRYDITEYHRETEEGIDEGYEYNEISMTPTEYIDVQNSYTGNISALKIINLKAKLADTDYVVAKIAEAEDQTELRKQYAEILENRKKWREEIRSLE